MKLKKMIMVIIINQVKQSEMAAFFLFKIYGKNGKLIEMSSDLPHEAEVLFKSNTTFFVENVNKGARHPLDKSRKITEIILKEK